MIRADYLLRRLFTSLVVIAGVLTLTFVITRILPSDPAQLIAGQRARPEQVAAIRSQLGLDRPLPEQFVRYLGGLARGDLGRSFATKRSVREDLGIFLPATLELVLCGFALALVIGIPAGILAGANERSAFDRVTGVAAILGAAAPVFALALLAKLKRSGCELILIGFESLEVASLRQMRKPWNAALGERTELVRRIHDAGIGIYATFVFGYDGDTAATFERTLEFAEASRFFTAAFNHLLPFPGTPLYARLAGEGRLIHDKWWLADGYSYGQLAFRPAAMSAEEMASRCRDARKRFASPRNLGRRGLASVRRSAPAMWPLFWVMNTRLGEEVDEKMNVPLAAHLDEWPK